MAAKRSEPRLNTTPDQALLANAADFLNGGIEMLFADGATSRSAKVAIVAIQTSLELLAKFRLTSEMGLASIVEGKLPQGPVKEILRKGDFRTIGYAKCLTALDAIEPLNEMDAELVRDVARLRNRLVHFSAEVDLQEVRVTAAHLVLKGLNRFAAGQTRDIGEFQNHCSILTRENFIVLTTFAPYRAEAVDDAIDNIDTEDVFRCWECEVDSLSLRASQTYFCHCCGLTADSSVAAFVGCFVCDQSRMVVYDPLNATNGNHDGKCLSCRTRQSVSICDECGAAHSHFERRMSKCLRCSSHLRISSEAARNTPARTVGRTT
jgi:hypothetical protein